MPGEIRFWSETFKTESPQTLEWAFREYLRTAKFFPKPGDITELIEKHRETPAEDTYDREKRLQAAYAAHGCDNSWVKAPNGKGVVRCQKCVSK